MAEENTDIKKDEPSKEPSGLSAVPKAPAVPPPDTVAQAFASFEKEHERHATIQATPPPAPKIDPVQVKPSTPIGVQPTPTPAAPAVPVKPTQVPPVASTPVSSVPTQPTQAMQAVPPHPVTSPTISVAVTIPKPVPPVVQQSAPAPEIKIVPPMFPKPIASSPIAEVQTPPAPVTQLKTTPVSPVHTPTPIVPASFPIAPVVSVQKPATPITPQASVLPKITPTSAPDQDEKKAPQTAISEAVPTTTPKAKPAQPTVVESLRAQSSSPLHPLRTLRSDVEGTVKDRKTSMITVAAAEENRRASNVEVMPLNDPSTPKKKNVVFLIISALILLVLGGGLLVFAFMPTKKVPISNEPQLPASTLLFADEIIPFPLADENRTSAMSELVQMRENAALSIGLIREIYPTKIATSTTVSQRAEITPVFQLLAPHASDALLRTLESKYILGVHVFDGNQAFLVVTTSSYEQTFAGMIEWEQNMLADLLPLFDRRPRPRTPDERLSTTTKPFIINTGFADMVIENHDARVLKDSSGNIVLLWTFINQNTLAITTNERTLAELVSRIHSAPALGL